jgi:hypothetical protein
VSETILRLLAENGKHFTELAPDAQITVAVVFRPSASPAPIQYYYYPTYLYPNPSTVNPSTYPAYPNPFASIQLSTLTAGP